MINALSPGYVGVITPIYLVRVENVIENREVKTTENVKTIVVPGKFHDVDRRSVSCRGLVWSVITNRKWGR